MGTWAMGTLGMTIVAPFAPPRRRPRIPRACSRSCYRAALDKPSRGQVRIFPARRTFIHFDENGGADANFGGSRRAADRRGHM